MHTQNSQNSHSVRTLRIRRKFAENSHLVVKCEFCKFNANFANSASHMHPQLFKPSSSSDLRRRLEDTFGSAAGNPDGGVGGGHNGGPDGIVGGGGAGGGGGGGVLGKKHREAWRRTFGSA